MAVRNSKPKSSSGASGVGRSVFYWVTQLLLWVLFFAAGAISTNWDRLPELPSKLRGVPTAVRQSAATAIAPKARPAATPKGKAAAASEVRGKIVKVYDGDTATMISDAGEKYKIRFYGIDAPEAKQICGPESGARLRALIMGREVRLTVMATDRYGRTVAKVYCDDVYINRLMVRDGMAWYYEAYAKGDHELETAMIEAKLSRRGLWEADDPQPPWEYRASIRK